MSAAPQAFEMRPDSPAAPPALVRERDGDFRVAARAYCDAAVFTQEMKAIFSSTWIYLGHESELPEIGSFKSTRLGLHPVVMVRGRDGRIAAFLNACRHRGAMLVREESGRCKGFTCPYHAWSYALDGSLDAVPDRERQAPGFDRAANGLLPVPRVEVSHGLVFGCMKADVADLASFLAPVRAHLDLWHDRSLGQGYSLTTAHRYSYPGNWKLQSENVVDGYHPGIVHRSAFSTFRAVGHGDFNTRFAAPIRREGCTRGFKGGHSTLEGGWQTRLDAASDDAVERYRLALERTHGEARTTEILSNRHIFVFPNVAIMDANIRVIQPIDVARTEVYSYVARIRDGDAEINSARLLDTQLRLGTAGLVAPDDLEIFAGIQSALSSSALPWVQLGRGLEEGEARVSETVGKYTDEVPQRAFWRQWQAAMSAQGAGS